MKATNGKKRVVVTGMAINTPIGDELETFYQSLVAGRSAISKWKFFDSSRVYSKVGGDLSDYDWKAKLAEVMTRTPEEVGKRLRKIVNKAPFSTRISLLSAADAYLDSGLNGKQDPYSVGVVVGGHNLHNNLIYDNTMTFTEEPEFINGQLALLALDTDHAASVGEVLGFHGPVYTVGGACASFNVALRNAMDEIRHHGQEVFFVVGAPLDFSPVDLHAMAIMGAISYQSFNDAPERASRPYDKDREGFIPSHGGGVLVVEEYEHALARGAKIYAELLDVETVSDGCHLPTPSEEGQVRTMQKLLANAGVAPEEVDYINAHATSTPLGDITEVRSIKRVFGKHAYALKVNATKSMLGHCCWSAPVVETIAAILQMKHGRLHPSINVENIDPEVDLDVCAEGAVSREVRCFMKNSFGFGGINCCALYRQLDA